MKTIALPLLLLTSLMGHAQTFLGSTGNISDDGTANNYTATVSGLGALGTAQGLVQVCIDISHTYDSDLNVTLIAPDGTAVNLFSGIGGNGQNISDCCLGQSAATPISQGAVPFTGFYKPMESIGNVNNGQNGNGLWTLRILDTYPFADTGTLNNWSLEFGAGAAVPLVFTESNLPIVIVNTGGNPIPDEPKIDGTLQIIDNGIGNLNHPSDSPAFTGNIGIELRGNYSQSLPQKPYKFETRDATGAELDVPLLGMPDEHDWCLIASYNDKVFMRNALAYDLFAEMGHYAPRHRYCEVVVNGVYQGIFLLTEELKRDNNRIDIAKLNPDENTGLDLTGGYIIKNDYWSDQDSWLLGYHPLDHPDFDVHLVYEYPKPANISPQQKTYIQGFVQNLEAALYGNNFTDSVSGYAHYLDMDSFIDYFIVNELARNNDGFKKSSYFHKDKDSATATATLHAGPVWDFDWAWKNIDECGIFAATDGSGWAYKINDCYPDVNSPGWYVRLLQDPAFRDRLQCRWSYFRSNFLGNAALDNYIDEKATLLQQAQQRHFERWQNLGMATGTPEVDPDPATFDGQIAKFKNWIHLRLAWLDANMPGSSAGCNLDVDGVEKPSLSAYPNPANDKIWFSGVTKETEVSVYEVSGKLVMRGTVDKDGSLALSHLTNGLYFAKIIVYGKSQVTRIVILH